MSRKPVRWPADQVERWPIERVIPHARNARQHTDAQVAQIASSMREWGWTNPVLVDEDGTLIAGHGRVLAARQLGHMEVPVMIARGWTEAQKRAYMIADNKLALNARWDDELLSVELTELGTLDFDLTLLGFSPAEQETILRGWHSDFEPTERDGENLDGLACTLKIAIDPDDEPQVRELITAALDVADVSYEFK